MGQLRTLETAKDAAIERDRLGRELVKNSAQAGEVADRIAGLAESAAGRRQARALGLRIAVSESEALRLGQEYFEKRTERRQAETLIDETLARDAVEAERRSQQGLDDWYSSRRFNESADSEQ